MRRPLASIDLGTNTVRLLIGTVEPGGSIHPVLIKRWITRLGGGFTVERGISEEARARTVVALRDFATELRRHNVSYVQAVATSAVRDAVNGRQFCAEIFRETGIHLEIIDGVKEGMLTLRGVVAGLDERPQRLMVFDIGGGSTEFTIVHDGTPCFTLSLPLGVVRLTEGKSTQDAMEEKISRELTLLRDRLKDQSLLHFLDGTTLVGTAGTATTLAAMCMKMTDYDYRRVNNYTVSLDEIRHMLAVLLPMTPEERLSVPGLEKGREDLIIAGILITVKTMELFGFTRLKVSDFGLLEGVLLWADELRREKAV